MRYLLPLLMTLACPLSAEQVEVTAKGAHGILAGSYIPTQSHHPPILIIPGSGPIDRNGLRAGVHGIGAYERLARALQNRGVGTIRIDKRGSFASENAIRSPDDLRINGYANDTQAWIRSIRDATNQPCIWVLGHSEGGLVATVAAAQNPEGMCGLILVAAPGRHIDVILRDQLARFTKSKRVRGMIDQTLISLKAGQIVDAKDLPLLLKVLFTPVNQHYFMDWMTYDPAAVIKDISIPVLILQGDKDVQIAVQDAQTLHTALPQSDMVIIGGMNHSFLQSDLKFPPKNTPISPQFLDEIISFLNQTAP